MGIPLFRRLTKRFEHWLINEDPNDDYPLLDFDRLRYEVRPCDVILVEGRSRVSTVISQITQSPWTHAAIYIGRIHDIENPVLRERVQNFYQGPADVQLMIESILGKGTIVSPIDDYKDAHVRICRPRGISRSDSQQVIGYSIGKLGYEYDVRQILDLARFLFPWSILPRRFRSSLFEHHIGNPTRIVCSTLIAEAFSAVNFPILPLVKKDDSKTGVELIRRNPKLYTPKDFDYSPYFEIIKYPVFELSAQSSYRNLPWSKDLISNDTEGVSSTSEVKADMSEEERLKNGFTKSEN